MPVVLGLIPARGGSRGLPGKNLKILGGKPLIAHSILSAKVAGCLDRVLVSTEDAETASIATSYGAEAPWLRPAELATDEASSLDVTLHALDSLMSVGYCPDSVLLLQPTSPFRTPQTICKAVEMHFRNDSESVIGVSPVKHHPYWCKRIDSTDSLDSFLPDIDMPHRRQELPPAYVPCGAVYLASVKTLRTQNSYYSGNTKALVIIGKESLDIDSALDWQIAQCLYAS